MQPYLVRRVKKPQDWAFRQSMFFMSASKFDSFFCLKSPRYSNSVGQYKCELEVGTWANFLHQKAVPSILGRYNGVRQSAIAYVSSFRSYILSTVAAAAESANAGSYSITVHMAAG